MERDARPEPRSALIDGDGNALLSKSYWGGVGRTLTPYLRRQWCVDVVMAPIRTERQPDGRIRFWGFILELPGYYLRVVTLEDGTTIHNAFLDRRFRP